MKKLEEMFYDLTDLEVILQRLNENKEVKLLPNPRTIRIIELGIRGARREVKGIYKASKTNIEFRKPNAKLSSIKRRVKREAQSRDLYNQLDDYFKDEKI